LLSIQLCLLLLLWQSIQESAKLIINNISLWRLLLAQRHTVCSWAFIALWSMSASTSAVAQSAPLPDPEGSGVIIGAVNWLQGTLLGTFATVVAVIAVASVGFLMLSGRIDWRRGATVILGCFILFGAASIVGGIRSSLGQ
jgi:type IV secretory pathway VirB2 component (pilin)